MLSLSMLSNIRVMHDGDLVHLKGSDYVNVCLLLSRKWSTLNEKKMLLVGANSSLLD